MDIKFKGKYKSLQSFKLYDIPKLMVLTGLNGVGKSQLLKLINDNCSNGINDSRNQFINEKEGYEINFRDFHLDSKSTIFWESKGAQINIENYSFGYEDLKFFVVFLKNHINKKHKENRQLLEYNGSNNYSFGKYRLRNNLNNKKDKIVKYLEDVLNKNKEQLTAEDISYFFPDDILLEDNDLLSQDSLDLIFFMYLYRKTAKEKYNIPINISEKAPWIILNEVMESANFDYQIKEPDSELVESIFRNAINDVESNRLKVELINPKNKENIGFQNLSSGERIIASLALLLYYTKKRNQAKGLLILDEPDAHLHPSLTKHFFDVINDVIIKKHGARVIMATHSPSTIAIAPKKSIFVIEKNPTLIKKTSKDIALKILTSGVSFLSINYENRRQIFVESKYDVKYYEKIYLILSKHLNPEISLNFISSGNTRHNHTGNCEQVIKITETLRKSGNNQIWGIIDYDNKNQTNDYVKVIGENERYSIENFILDPLLVSALLLREKLVNKSEFGFDNEQTFFSLKSFSQAKLQSIIDYFVLKLNNNSRISSDKTNRSVKLVNGFHLSIPVWYLTLQGHKLEEKILNTYPKLNSIKQGKEDKLKLAIIEKVMDDIPEIIPVSFLNTFIDIQK